MTWNGHCDQRNTVYNHFNKDIYDLNFIVITLRHTLESMVKLLLLSICKHCRCRNNQERLLYYIWPIWPIEWIDTINRMLKWNETIHENNALDQWSIGWLLSHAIDVFVWKHLQFNSYTLWQKHYHQNEIGIRSSVTNVWEHGNVTLLWVSINWRNKKKRQDW